MMADPIFESEESEYLRYKEELLERKSHRARHMDLQRTFDQPTIPDSPTPPESPSDEADPEAPATYQLELYPTERVSTSDSAKLAVIEGIRQEVPLEIFEIGSEGVEFIDNRHGPDWVGYDTDHDNRLTPSDKLVPLHRALHSFTPRRTVVIPGVYDNEKGIALTLITGTKADSIMISREPGFDPESLLRSRIRNIISSAVYADTMARKRGSRDENARLEEVLYGFGGVGKLFKPDLPDILGEMSLSELQELSEDLMQRSLESEWAKKSEKAIALLTGNVENNPYLTGELLDRPLVIEQAEELAEFYQGLRSDLSEGVEETRERITQEWGELVQKWDAIMPGVKVVPRFGPVWYSSYLLFNALMHRASGRPVGPVSAGVMLFGAGTYLTISTLNMKKALRKEREQKELERLQHKARIKWGDEEDLLQRIRIVDY
jgi:hypothetical protein